MKVKYPNANDPRWRTREEMKSKNLQVGGFIMEKTSDVFCSMVMLIGDCNPELGSLMCEECEGQAPWTHYMPPGFIELEEEREAIEVQPMIVPL